MYSPSCFHNLPFSGVTHPHCISFMHSWNLSRLLPRLADSTWQDYLRITVPFCIWELLCIYVGSGYFIRIEIAHDPDHIQNICEWVLWLIGSDIREL